MPQGPVNVGIEPALRVHEDLYHSKLTRRGWMRVLKPQHKYMLYCTHSATSKTIDHPDKEAMNRGYDADVD